MIHIIDKQLAMGFSAVIVDDEELARSYLRSCIEKHCPMVEVVGEAANAQEAIVRILEDKPDAVFLDIEMPGGDGFEIVQQVPRELIPRFVFTTAHDKYAIRALREGALDYLLKPVKARELQAACLRVMEMLQSRSTRLEREVLDQRISVTHQLGFNMVCLANLVHLKADNNYTELFLEDGSHFTSSYHLGYFEQRLPAQWFLRTHRSYMINLHHLKEYSSREGGDVVMSNGQVVPIARSRMSDFLQHVAMLGPARV